MKKEVSNKAEHCKIDSHASTITHFLRDFTNRSTTDTERLFPGTNMTASTKTKR